MEKNKEIETKLDLTLQPKPQYVKLISKFELDKEIREGLISAGHERLLNDGEIKFEIEETFPTAEVIVIGFTFLSKIAFETYKEIIIPIIKKRFGIHEKEIKS